MHRRGRTSVIDDVMLAPVRYTEILNASFLGREACSWAGGGAPGASSHWSLMLSTTCLALVTYFHLQYMNKESYSRHQRR
jgi:hypothetical protein